MYHALLTNRYLTSRVIPLIAVAAVALCVALVIIVVSVMTGFLNMVKSSGRTLMGDVVISAGVEGIPHYDRLLARLRNLPEAAAATPAVDGLGILKMPYDKTETVQFWGIEPASFAQVTGYEGILHWRELTSAQWEMLMRDVLSTQGVPSAQWETLLRNLSEGQKIQMLRWMMTDPADPQRVPDEQRLRDGLAAIDEEGWRQILNALASDREAFKKALTESQWRDLMAHDPRLAEDDRILTEGLTLKHGDPPDDRTIVLGMHVSMLNQRQQDGTYTARRGFWMLRHDVTLTTIPITGGTIGGADSAESRTLQVVNEFVSGVFVIDDKRVMVPLSIAQDMLHLNEGVQRMDPDDPFKVTGIEPARVTMVLVRAAPGITAERLRDVVDSTYRDFVREVAEDDNMPVKPPSDFEVGIQTWEQQQASFIGPIEKEREMMRVLFSIVYLVCAGLVLSIFWAIVSEKTRDIGILRSVGASREGVLWIFTRYGLMTGALGSLLGLLLGTLIVNRINPIQDALAKPPILLAIMSVIPCLLAATWVFVRGGLRSVLWMGLNLFVVALGALAAAGVMRWASVDPAVMLGARWEFILGGALILILACLFAFVNLIRIRALVSTFVGTLIFMLFLSLATMIFLAHKYGGFRMWDPEVYYFTQIPNAPDWQAAWGTVFLAIMFSVLGAAVAAAKAADTDPVQALRYE